MRYQEPLPSFGLSTGRTADASANLALLVVQGKLQPIRATLLFLLLSLCIVNSIMRVARWSLVLSLSLSLFLLHVFPAEFG